MSKFTFNIEQINSYVEYKLSFINKYTHGNKLGNTFSHWGKFEKIHFPFFWRY